MTTSKTVEPPPAGRRVERIVGRVLCVLIALAAPLWLIIVPLIWYLVVHDQIGMTEAGQQFRVDYVEPFPSRELWCFVGTWIRDDETIELPNGVTILIGNRSFAGRCFVSKLRFE